MTHGATNNPAHVLKEKRQNMPRYRYRYKSFESDEKAAADESSRGF